MASRAMAITANGGTVTTQGRYGAGTVHPQTVTATGTLHGSWTAHPSRPGHIRPARQHEGFTGGVSVIAEHWATTCSVEHSSCR